LAIAKVLQGGPRSVAQAFKDYAAAHDMEKSGGGLFGAPSREEAFNASFPSTADGKLARLTEPEKAEYEQAKQSVKAKLSSSRLKSSDPYGLRHLRRPRARPYQDRQVSCSQWLSRI
jgi:hypothetical protein